jgi:probable rRNA maturation factor
MPAARAPRARLIVDVTDGRGRRIRGDRLARWLPHAAPRSARGRVAIAIVSDAEMTRLNRTYRGKNTPTDVLSFSEGDGPRTAARTLGNLAIARGVAARQARQFGHSDATELKILALHGLLHLLGYDHDTDHGEMARAESRLRRRAGLPDGLIARAGTGRHRA